VVTHYGDALARKILVDISNPFNADATGLATTPDSSAAQEIAAAVPKAHRRESADVHTSPNIALCRSRRYLSSSSRPIDGGHCENGP